MTILSLFKSILLLQMKIKFMYENNCPLVIFCGWMESQKLKTQKLKCYVLRPKSQKFPTAENTRYTVRSTLLCHVHPCVMWCEETRAEQALLRFSKKIWFLYLSKSVIIIKSHLHTIFTVIPAISKTIEMALTKIKFRDTVFS